jgi:hypothetical protein
MKSPSVVISLLARLALLVTVVLHPFGAIGAAAESTCSPPVPGAGCSCKGDTCRSMGMSGSPNDEGVSVCTNTSTTPQTCTVCVAKTYPIPTAPAPRQPLPRKPNPSTEPPAPGGTPTPQPHRPLIIACECRPYTADGNGDFPEEAKNACGGGPMVPVPFRPS